MVVPIPVYFRVVHGSFIVVPPSFFRVWLLELLGNLRTQCGLEYFDTANMYHQ